MKIQAISIIISSLCIPHTMYKCTLQYYMLGAFFSVTMMCYTCSKFWMENFQKFGCQKILKTVFWKQTGGIASCHCYSKTI